MGTKLDKTSRLQFELIDDIAETQTDTLNALRTAALSASEAGLKVKAANAEKKDAAPTVWGLTLAIAEAVAENDKAAELAPEKIVEVFSTVILDTLTGKIEVDGTTFDLEPAQKTVKAYLSTGKKALNAVLSKQRNWHQFKTKLVAKGDEMAEQGVTYDEVRDMLKSDGQKELDEVAANVIKMITKVRGKESDTRSVNTRMEALLRILAAVTPEHDAVKKADADKERTTGKGRAAAAASELRQQQPATATVVETVPATGTEG